LEIGQYEVGRLIVIGILCGSKKENQYSEKFHKLFKPLLKGKKIEIIVFSLSNTNLLDKTVYGSLISGESIVSIKAAIPPLIFNFATQYSRLDVKKCRSLMEVDDVVLINSTNQYNQYAIMDIISSNKKFRKILLPYSQFQKKDLISNFGDFANFILEPQSGANSAKIIYAKRVDSKFDVYKSSGFQSFHKFDIHDAISPIARKGKWILLKTPELLTFENNLLVTRAYLQKSHNGEWKIFFKSSLTQNRGTYEKFDQKTNAALLNIIEYINCFIPDIGFCFIDFAMSLFGTPYYLNLGGWDNQLLNDKQNIEIQTSLCKNILEFARSHFEKRRYTNYVD
jgi:hypothetical protein